MKTRHIVAIGLLTATAVGIVALSIAFKKNKPKLCEVKAESAIFSYNYNNNKPNWEIFSQPTSYNLSSDYGGITNPVQTDTTINKQNTNITITIEALSFISNEFADNYLIIDESAISTATLTEYQAYNITYIDLYQEVTISDDRDYPLIAWEIEYTTTIHFNDYTTRNIFTYITTEPININQWWIEPSENIYHFDTINVADTLATLKNTYATGYNTAEGVASPIDIRGLMLNVLTMPFTFINQAFNVTLWEGTPYAFNISTFIKTIIAIGTILFIIKMFTSGFSVIGNYTNNRTTRDLRKSQTELNKAKTEKINRSTKKDK